MFTSFFGKKCRNDNFFQVVKKFVVSKMTNKICEFNINFIFFHIILSCENICADLCMIFREVNVLYI